MFASFRRKLIEDQPNDQQSETGYIVATLSIVGAYYAYSLSFGYLWDDAWEVVSDLSRANEQVQMHFRPLYYYTFALTNSLFDAPWQHRLVNLALLLGCVCCATRIALRVKVPCAPIVVCSIFLHPTFIYPATWITQHLDLWLILFVLLAILNLHRTRGLIYVLLSDLAKAPFILQNIWYAVRRYSKPSGKIPALLALVPVPLILVHIYIFWLGIVSVSTSPMSNLTETGIIPTLFALGVRAAKMLEGIFLGHIPIAGYYDAFSNSAVILILCLYAVLWTLVWLAILRRIRTNNENEGWKILILAVMMSVPFAINTDPRVLGPAIPLFYLGTFALAPRSTVITGCAVSLLLLNVGAATINYRISDTGTYSPEFTQDYIYCGEHELQFPMERWRCDRGKLAARFVQLVNGVLAR